MYCVVEKHGSINDTIFVTHSWEEVSDYFSCPGEWSKNELNNYLKEQESPYRVVEVKYEFYTA